jgi:hypothetical protein
MHPTPLKVRKATLGIPGNHFYVSVNDIVAFALTSLALDNFYPFWTLFSLGNKKISGGKFEEYGGCSKAGSLCLAKYFVPPRPDVQVRCRAPETNCFVPIFLNFSFSQLPWRDGGFRSMFLASFWNKFLVDETLFSSFVEAGGLPQCRSSLTLARPSRKYLSLVDLRSLHCRLTIRFFKRS